MIENVFGVLLGVVGLYLALGMAAAVALHARGLARIDPGVREAGTAFRLLITPGMVALWPLLLGRWRAAARGAAHHGVPDQPVAAAGLRRRHLRLSQALTVVVLALAAAGLIARPGTPPADPSGRRLIPQPEALPEVVRSWPEPFAGQPIVARLRADRSGGRQIELEVATDLEIPGTVLFWSSPGSDRKVFLGAVWGPGVRRYELPAGAVAGEGRVSLYSMGHRAEVGELDLARTATAGSGG